jgi:hypothetical protein
MRQIAAKSLIDVPSSRRSCAQCGLVNFGEAETCRRCHCDLVETAPAVSDIEAPASIARSARRTLLIVAATVGVSIFAWSRSLLLTSEPIDESQRLMVMRSVELLERAGFSREVTMLRHFANYRATDNWWNNYLGHSQAYAATNFPLGVVTLYAPFFRVATDDTERAAILLHEAQHLLGAGEPAALELTWREKSRLGWTAEKYGESKVWKNTKEWTIAEVPSLFECGGEGHDDCVK